MADLSTISVVNWLLKPTDSSKDDKNHDIGIAHEHPWEPAHKSPPSKPAMIKIMMATGTMILIRDDNHTGHVRYDNDDDYDDNDDDDDDDDDD